MDSGQKKKIDSLIPVLDCDDAIGCQKARRQLVRMGGAAVPALIAAASNGGLTRRLEAMRALGAIGGPQAIEALTKNLGDSDPGIRWAASDALFRVGEPAIVPVLKALISNGRSSPFREGVHHLLIDAAVGSDPNNSILEPVITSLEESGADLAAPVAAEIALDKLRAFHINSTESLKKVKQ